MARWLVRVRTAAPDIPPDWALALARSYRVHRDDDWENVRYLDMVLILRPWVSESDLDWFVYTVQRSRRLLGEPTILQFTLSGLVDDRLLEDDIFAPPPKGRRLRAWG